MLTTGGHVKKVLWASYGDSKDSWFFVFQLRNDEVLIRLGKDSPRGVHDLIRHMNKEVIPYTRVHFGSEGSFVV